MEFGIQIGESSLESNLLSLFAHKDQIDKITFEHETRDYESNSGKRLFRLRKDEHVDISGKRTLSPHDDINHSQSIDGQKIENLLWNKGKIVHHCRKLETSRI